MEYIMSENSEIENETQSHMDDMLQAIQYKNLAQSRHHFDALMADKVSDALENEKVNIASQIYSPQVEDEEPEFDAAIAAAEQDAEEWDGIEAELMSSFEESDEEEEVE